jgi:hypothetical protein
MRGSPTDEQGTDSQLDESHGADCATILDASGADPIRMSTGSRYERAGLPRQVSAMMGRSRKRSG